MSLNQIVLNQSGWFTDWYVFRQPLGFLIFFIAATAEANRTPFDLTEADSEIVAGFATEYSGMRFGFFFFAEYVNVFIISALTVTLFFGGWNAPFPWPWPVTVGFDPGSLGIGLLILVAVVPLVLTLVFAAPVLDGQLADQGLAGAASAGSSWPTCSSSRSSARGRTSGSTGSPACSGSSARRTSSCSPSCGCAARCPASGSTS